MPLVSITRLRVRSWYYLPSFFVQTFRSGKQAVSAEGNLGLALLRDAKKTFWTRTTWTDEAAMKSFMRSGAHGSGMRDLLEWCDEAALVHWTQETSQPPSWEEAYRRLQQEGRLSKVNHPSAAHQAFQIEAPVIQASRQLVVK